MITLHQKLNAQIGIFFVSEQDNEIYDKIKVRIPIEDISIDDSSIDKNMMQLDIIKGQIDQL